MGLVGKLLDFCIPVDEMGKETGNRRENDCVSRLIVLFGCFYISSIFDIGIVRRKDHFAAYFFSRLLCT